MNPIPRVVRWAGCAALGLLLGAASPLFGLTLVARSGLEFGGVTPTGFFSQPSVNNLGEVVFVASQGGGQGSVIMSSTRGLRVGIGDDVAGFSFDGAFGSQPVVNDLGAIAFSFRTSTGSTVVATESATGQRASVYRFGTDTVGGLSLSSIGQLGFNNNGRVIINSTSLSPSTQGMYALNGPNPGPLLIIGSQVGGVTVTGINGATADGFNDANTMVTRINSSPTRLATQSALLASPPVTIGGRSIATFNPGVSINNSGQVAFMGFYGGGNGIFTLDRQVAATGTTVGGRVISGFDGDVAIDAQGGVAYLASFTDGGGGLFYENTLLVASGDTIGGLTVTGFNVPVLNDFGQIAFRATFEGGVTGIVSTVIPEPAVAGLGAALVAFWAVARRRRG